MSKPQLLRCYCNDDSLCPLTTHTNNYDSYNNHNYYYQQRPKQEQQQQQQTPGQAESAGSQQQQQPFEIDPANALNRTYLEGLDLKKLETDTNGNIRSCSTSTVCLTKKLRRTNGQYWLKYSCDILTKKSIRHQIIEYRDCKMDRAPTPTPTPTPTPAMPKNKNETISTLSNGEADDNVNNDKNNNSNKNDNTNER